MSTYAARTEVPAERSRNEIEQTLARYGASAFGYLTQADRAVLVFEANGRRIRLDLPMPARDEFAYTPTRMQRSAADVDRQYDQAKRQRWRALLLIIKAKLEAIEAGVSTFEDEFLAHIALPDGTTMGERAKPAIAHAYQTGTMPALLPGGPS